jgi:ATP-dependent RNA helicase RhlE
MRLDELPLIEPLKRAVAQEGYHTATPIQEQTIPPGLEGRDILGIAQTGTGKTAAFALPILQRLSARPAPAGRPLRSLILAPTRELAAQIGDSFRTYGRHVQIKSAVIFGGVGYAPQVQALRQGLDVLVATPGRLLDLMHQKLARLDRVEIFVLDEADRMLDMGFVQDIRKITPHLPSHRQTLLFSATLPAEIVDLAHGLLRNPVKVTVAPETPTLDLVKQSVYFVPPQAKFDLLKHLLGDALLSRVLVFVRTKRGADKLAKKLAQERISAEAIHGNKSQGGRVRALKGFKDGSIRVLVASDIASRGLDIDELSHVINHDLPNVPETYVHRIGRTGRAGAAGTAISFCSREEREYLRDIQRLVRRDIPVVREHAYSASADAEPSAAPRGPSPFAGGRRKTTRIWHGQHRRSGPPRRPRGHT